MTEISTLQRRAFEPHDVLFMKGDTGDCAYLVQRGRIRIEIPVQGGAPRVLGHIGPGGIFGEMALIQKAPRMATAVAEDPTECVVIPEDLFRRKIDALDPFNRAIVRILVNNIRSLTATAPSD